jgi:Tol biopolymer transport system component
MPDGKGVTYITRVGDTSTLWLQPIDGGKPTQMTDPKQGLIYRRQWSNDGKRVAIVRGSQSADAVLLTGF